MLVRRTWTTDSIIAFLFWVLIGLFGVSLIGASASWLFPEQSESVREFYVGIAGMLCFYAALIVGVIRLLQGNGTTWVEAFGLRRQPVGSVASWAVAAAVLLTVTNFILMAISNLVYRQLEVDAPLQEHVQMLRAPQGILQPLLIGFMAILVAPVMEEILFRGVLYPGLKAAGFPGLAWIGSAALFALAHGNLLGFVPLVFLGLALIWLYERTETLWVPIFTHILFNLANYVMALTLG